MSTETQTVPTYKSLEKIDSIPLVHDTVYYAHDLFRTNPYTQSLYNYSLAIGNQAYELSKPVQKQLSPITTRIDSAVLSGIETAEKIAPYPFQKSANDIIDDVKATSDSAYSKFYTNVGEPALGVVQSADKQLSPIVDQYENVLNKFTTEPTKQKVENATSSDGSQVARAYRLTIDAQKQLIVLTTAQVQQLQEHNELVARVTESIKQLREKLIGASKEGKAKGSDIADDASKEVQSVQSSFAQFPTFLNESTKPIQAQLAHSLDDLKKAATSDSGVEGKGLITTALNQFGPLLEALKESAANLSKPVREHGADALDKAKSLAGDAEKKADGAASDAKDKASDVASDAQKKADSAASDAKSTGKDLQNKAGETKDAAEKKANEVTK